MTSLTLMALARPTRLYVKSKEASILKKLGELLQGVGRLLDASSNSFRNWERATQRYLSWPNFGRTSRTR